MPSVNVRAGGAGKGLTMITSVGMGVAAGL